IAGQLPIILHYVQCLHLSAENRCSQGAIAICLVHALHGCACQSMVFRRHRFVAFPPRGSNRCRSASVTSWAESAGTSRAKAIKMQGILTNACVERGTFLR